MRVSHYGVGKRIQLKFEIPWVGTAGGGESTRTGAGNSVVGMKWRFIGQEGQTLAWSVYPQLEYNTAHSSVTKGLVEQGKQFLLPTEITLELRHIEINGEVGRDFVERGASVWIYGLSTEAGIAHRLEVLAEVHGEQQPRAPAEVILNVGAREKLTRRMILMVAAGRAVRGVDNHATPVLLYAGLQFVLPGLYSFKQVDSRLLYRPSHPRLPT